MTETTTTERRAACNTSLAKVAVQFSADTFVVNQNLVLRINIFGENRHLHQALKRLMQITMWYLPLLIEMTSQKVYFF
jgi:hypothetical protein